MPFIKPTNKHTCQLPNLSGLSIGTQWYCEHCNRLYIISLSPENKQVSWYLYGIYNPIEVNQTG